MKKTLFLSTMLATALCSTAFADKVVADYSTTEDDVTYSGAIVEYKGSADNQLMGTAGWKTTITKGEADPYDCNGAGQNPNLGGTNSNLWAYFTEGQDNTVYGQTLKMSGSTGSAVQLAATSLGSNVRFGGLITSITSEAEGAANGSYVLYGGGDYDLLFEGSSTTGVNMSIGANTTVKMNSNKTVEVKTSGTWNIASGKTLTLEGGRIFVDGDTTVNLTGGGTLTFNITNTAHKLQLDAGAKFDVKNGTTVVLDNSIGNYAFGAGAGFYSSDNSGTLKLTASEVQYHSHTHLDTFTGHVVISGGTLQVGNYGTKFQNAADLTITDNGIIKGWGTTFTRDLILNNGGLGDAGNNETFSGTITLQGTNSYASVNGGYTVKLSGAITGTSLTKKEAGTLTIEGEAKSFGSLKSTGGVTNVNADLTLSGSLESGSATVNVNKNVTAGSFASTGNGGHINIANGATLSVSDSSSGQGLWLDPNSSVTVANGSTLEIGDGKLTITAANTSGATIERLGTTANAAKLGVTGHADYLKNVKLTNAVVNYEGSDILYLGSMQGGSLNAGNKNIQFFATDSSIGTLTLNGNSITLGNVALGAADSHDNYTLTLNKLIVGETAGSAINANLQIADNGWLDFSAGQSLTMGCDVTLGSGVTVQVSSDKYAELIAHGEGASITIFTGVDQFDGPAAVTVTDGENSHVFLMTYTAGVEGGTLSIVPEPATATLSLLALAGLCARRRRK